MRDLTLQEASQILQGAVAKAREMNLKPLGVVVLDRAGDVKAVAREDGASPFRFDIARGKAFAAAAMGMSSRKLGEFAKINPTFLVSLAATAKGNFLPQMGAVLITTTDGEVLGAVGASGAHGEEDEAVCMAGIEAAGLVVGP